MKRSYDGTKKRKIYRSTLKRPTSLTATLKKSPLYRPIVARSQTCNMIYGESFVLNATTGVSGASAVVFSANSLYDPNFSGLGHQPRGYDQMMEMYSRYRVKRVVIQAWFESESSTASALVSVACRKSQYPLTSPYSVLEDADAVIKIIGGTNGNSNTYITRELDLASWLKPYDKLDASGEKNVNPAQQMYIHIATIPVNPGDDLPAMNGRARITYETEFSDPIDPGQS